MGRRGCCNVGWRTGRDDVSALVARARAASITQPLPVDDAHLVLDDDDGVAGVNEAITNPSPWHVSQRPFATLNEKRPASSGRARAAFVDANSVRTGSNSPVSVARFARGVRPIDF